MSNSIIAYPAPRGASQALALIDAHRLYRDAYGFHTLPVRNDKTPDSTRLPLEDGKPRWHFLQERMATDDDILAWSESYGVAIVPADDVVVVDLDEGHRASLGSDHPLPATPTVKTPHGYHLYFEAPAVPIANKAGILKSVDLRSRGGYAIAPPTPGYEWVEGLSPADVPLAPLPDWVVEKASRPRNASKSDLLAFSSPGSPGVALLRPTRGEDLVQRSNDPLFVRAAARVLGIPDVPFGRAFRCVVPGHDDRHPSATLWQNPETGQIWYHDFHGKNGREWLTLPQIRAAQAHQGKLQNRQSKQAREIIEEGLSRSQYVLWWLRLLVESGHVKPARVRMPRLPERLAANPEVVKVYQGFALLFGCRWLHSPGDPSPATWLFLRAWCGVPEHPAGTALRELLRHGVIREAGKYKDTTLFLPGN